MASNKLGDMLAEFNDPNVSISRKSEIKRYLNELGDREEKYKELLGLNGLFLKYPVIKGPTFFDTALSPLVASRTTDTTIVIDTDTPISFESVAYPSRNFVLDTVDPTKIRLLYPGQGFFLLGKAIWASNSSGAYRNAKLEAFTIDDSSLGVDILHSSAGWSGADNVFPYIGAAIENAFPTMAYFKFTVAAGGAGALTLNSFTIAVFAT